ncbi:hypothetical protein O4N70_25080 [Vibrio parahaemolyticus]|uniref:hypothetical protein n=1 Tax=Vibrio parahaemolyticus TaxID=670 RepID=UPI00215BCB03|nr:hypothetical protein [Vibrio parahaemolyticus]MCR9728402.1 hypothetical protein [Vibrio parahaemolyticus]MCR9785363.1 hypothetical protein [Vibrio parahaemolyticus]MCZ6417811.1 hypothetical protein [Vibrio parahaemolyticus]MCZ6422788.1 hypothetical protein [Vibrio parahaemolyticus]MDF4861597.1 hypothetical protein [Vibrio parahaemolyticus]
MHKGQNLKTIIVPNVYEIEVNAAEETSTYTVYNSDGKKNFHSSDNKRGGKIYMLIANDLGGTVRYVGQTIVGMRKRLYAGVRKQSYKWARESGKHTLLVWDLKNIVGDESSYDLDTIEAELVFAIRANQGDWPIGQTSIKFRWFLETNLGLDAHRIVIDLMEQFYSYLSSRPNLDSKSLETLANDKERVKSLLQCMRA